jgi:hypothetical protein
MFVAAGGSFRIELWTCCIVAFVVEVLYVFIGIPKQVVDAIVGPSYFIGSHRGGIAPDPFAAIGIDVVAIR